MSGNNKTSSMLMLVLIVCCACCCLSCVGSSGAIALSEDLRKTLKLDGLWNDMFEDKDTDGGGDGILPLDPEAGTGEAGPTCEETGTCPNNTGKSWLCPDPFKGNAWALRFDKGGKNPRCYEAAPGTVPYVADQGDQALSYNYRNTDRMASINRSLNAVKDVIDGPFRVGQCPVPFNDKGDKDAILFDFTSNAWKTQGRVGCVPRNEYPSLIIQKASPACVYKSGPKKDQVEPNSGIDMLLLRQGAKQACRPLGMDALRRDNLNVLPDQEVRWRPGGMTQCVFLNDKALDPRYPRQC